MPDAWGGSDSPLDRHTSTPQELKDRLAAERTGEAHLIYRDGDGGQVIRMLGSTGSSLTIGRREECDISLGWDGEVSRLHAELHSGGGDWTVADGGLSRNGTFVNAERLHDRRRLFNGDLLLVGRTTIVFRHPARAPDLTTTPGARTALRDSVSAADRRVLVALCRPLVDPAHRLPATNQAIGEELCLSVPAVKKRLSGLFQRFEVDDLPQSEKRARLAMLALHSGIVGPRDL
jgi:pSer/pThr/pTyr-binding forkhead associated (FHA) protein